MTHHVYYLYHTDGGLLFIPGLLGTPVTGKVHAANLDRYQSLCRQRHHETGLRTCYVATLKAFVYKYYIDLCCTKLFSIHLCFVEH